MARPSGDDRAEAVAGSLAPFEWRSFTDRMLARRVVGTVDRQTVQRFLGEVPGVDVGDAGPVAPADAGDERVDALVDRLDGRPWRSWSLGCLSAYLMSALDSWLADRDSFHAGLRRLLDGR